MNKNWLRIAALGVLACLCVKYSDAFLAVMTLLFQTIEPLIIGFCLAYVLNIVMKKIERVYFPKTNKAWVKKSRRPVCVFGSVFLLIFIVVVLLVMIVPALSESVYTLMKDIPTAFSQFQSWLSGLAQKSGYEGIEDMVNSMQIDWENLYNKISSFLTKGVTNVFSSLVSTAGQMASLCFNFVVALIFAIYLLFQKENLRRQMKKLAAAYFPVQWSSRAVRFLQLAHETFTSFISGQVVEAIILGTLCGAGLAILGLPYAVLIGVIVGATALIPVMGAYIGALVGAFLILTVSPAKAVEFVVYLVVLQQVEGNVIYPRVVGSSIGLPGIWVLAAVTIGGGLCGIPGMLLGVPLSATLYKWLRIDVNRRLRDNVEPPRIARIIKEKMEEEMEVEKSSSGEE